MFNAFSLYQLHLILYILIAIIITFFIVIICLFIFNRKLVKVNKVYRSEIKQFKANTIEGSTYTKVNELDIEFAKDYEKRVVKKAVDTTLEILGVQVNG